jgi:hypothetical protein
MRSMLYLSVVFLFSAGLLGCESTGPKVNESAAPGTPACSAGISPAQRTVAVEVWRGQEGSLSGYSTQRVCDRLDQVSRQLHSQGASVRFELMGGVQTHASLGVADNAAMGTALPRQAGRLQMVLVDAIAQCGSTLVPLGGFIRGCAPRVGQPLIFLNRQLFGDTLPEWVVWAHEMGHAVGLHHPDDVRPPTYPQRIMTYMAVPESTTLTAQEAPAFAQLGLAPGGVGSGAAVGVLPGNPPPVAPSELIAFVLNAGQHGLPLQALAHLSDEDLLRLRLLLEPVSQIGAPLLQQLSVPLRINALVPLAELGREQAQAYVRGYLLRQSDAASVDVRRYGLWALGRGQLRHPTPATREFLQQAGEPDFWCASQRGGGPDCRALALAARKAMADAGIQPAVKGEPQADPPPRATTVPGVRPSPGQRPVPQSVPSPTVLPRPAVPALRPAPPSDAAQDTLR